MSHNETDPAASTDKFRAFVDAEDSGTGGSRRPGAARVAVAAAVALAIVIVAVLVWLLL